MALTLHCLGAFGVEIGSRFGRLQTLNSPFQPIAIP